MDKNIKFYEVYRGIVDVFPCVSESESESFHHQPINVPTAGAQAFLMDYPQGKRAITHHAGPVRIGGC
jgi:hypothetical protein